MSGQSYLCEVCKLFIESTFIRGREVWSDINHRHDSFFPSPHLHQPKTEKRVRV